MNEGDGSARRYNESRASISIPISISFYHLFFVFAYPRDQHLEHHGTYTPAQSYLQQAAASYSAYLAHVS